VDEVYTHLRAWEGIEEDTQKSYPAKSVSNIAESLVKDEEMTETLACD
jgi:hypothetical protein